MRREGGRPGGGRAEGGARDAGGGCEGQRGREAGSVGGGRLRAGGRARGGGRSRRGRRGGEGRGIRGVEDPGVRALPFSVPSLSASPSRCSRPGLGAPDGASQLPGWRGRGRNGKIFRKLRGVAGQGLRGLAGRGRGRAAAPGGHTRPWPLWPASFRRCLQQRGPLPSSPGGPLLGSGGKGWSSELGRRLKDWGRGRPGPLTVGGAQTFARRVSAFV